MVTRKQKDFLNKLLDYYGKDPLPSYEQIAKDLGYKSKNSVSQYFQKLIDDGFLNMRSNRFFLSSDLFGIDYFEEGIRAGFPSPAEDYPVEKISFDSILIDKPASTFTVRVVGDSMVDAGIFEDDLAIVEKGREPKNGDVVVAIVDGDFTMKYYKKTATEVVLEPANDSYPTIRAQNELEIFGIVTGLVRKLKS